MNCASAKQIPIPRLLQTLGVTQVLEKGSSIWYHSPCSPSGDKTPSLQVSLDGYMFTDWSTGRSGNIIDLAMAIRGTNSVSEALEFIASLTGEARPSLSSSIRTSHSVSTQNVRKPQKPRIEIIETSPLHSPALLDYVSRRNIPATIAMRYCSEVLFRVAGQKRMAPYYAIGFQNNSGGFELRNAFAKMATAPKDITTIGNVNSGYALVFEGCFDFLTAAALGIFDCQHSYAIVLNTTSLLNRAFDSLTGAASVECYLDNDDAGRRATRTIMETKIGIVTDCSSFYQHYKDLNEYWCSVRS